MDTQDFSELNRRSATSFHEQKQLIKNLLAGHMVLCRHCGQQLQAQLPVAGENSVGYIRCNRGCTDIELEAAVPKR
jgi:hypothetical protein